MQLRWLRYGIQAAAVTAMGCGFLAGCGDDSNEGGGGSGASGSTTASTSSPSSTSGSPTVTTGTGTTTATSSSSGGGLAIASPCTSNEECEGGLCITEASGFGWAAGYCSQLCDPDLSPCTDGECLSAGSVSVCVKACDPGDPTSCDGVGQACVDLNQGEPPPANFCLGGCNQDSDCLAVNKCDIANAKCLPREICDNTMDEDGDGLIDCVDDECATDATCATQIGAECTGADALTLGVVASGTTADGSNLFSGVCASAFGNFNTGLGKEHLYTFTAPSDGTAHLVATAVAGDLGLYVRTTCADGSTEIACSDNSFDPGEDENADVVVHSGDVVTVFVDAFDDMSEGDYSLVATFTPAVCGNGDVEGPEECDDGNTTSGDGCDATCHSELAVLCAAATTIALGTTTGDTTTGTNAFEAPVDALECQDGAGPDGNEKLYVFTPAANGMLTIDLDPGTFDMGIYARTDCADATTQVGCSDVNFMMGMQAETLTIPVTSGVPVTIFIDAYGSAGGAFSVTLTQI